MRIPQIQALRAFAAILVVIYHAKLVSGGYIGVDIFYVISGYLITGLILRELENSGTLGLKTFYLRRIKRLLPASFFVLVVTGITAWIFYPSTMRAQLAKDIAAAGIYISNYLFASWQMDYQNLSAIPPVVVHYWSLAVEEQFYLVWPFIILMLYKRGGRKTVGIGVFTISIASFAWSHYLTTESPIWAFYSLPTRAWELGVGALLLYLPMKVKRSQIYIWVAIVLYLYGTIQFRDSTPFPGTAALIPVGATALAIANVKNWPGIINSLANLRSVQWLGEISYPLYLWHWPVLVIPDVYLGRPLNIVERLLCIVVSILLAYFTHRYVENPGRASILEAKRTYALLVMSIIVILVLAFTISKSTGDHFKINGGKSYSLKEILKKPIVYSDSCHVNYRETKSPSCTYGDIHSAQTIVLFGDSHAAQWFPALERIAQKRHYKLVSLTKSACPGPTVEIVEAGNYKNSDCFAWRNNTIKRIISMKPQAIIVSGFQHFEIPSRYLSSDQWWIEGMWKTSNALKGATSHLIYISDTPLPERNIPNCLVNNRIAECNGTQPSKALFNNDFKNIDPTQWLCGKVCPAVIDGHVVYRDASHLTVDMARTLSAKLDGALTRLGVFSVHSQANQTN